jgi:hypothetical protein
MQTLTEVSRDRSSVIVFPLPIDLLSSFKQVIDNVVTETNAGPDTGIVVDASADGEPSQ